MSVDGSEETPVGTATNGVQPEARTLGPAKRLARILLAVGVLAAGVATFVILVKTRPEPAKKERHDLGTLVEVVTLEREPQRVRVDVQGTVVAAREIVLQSEVSGRVVDQHEDLVPGGRIEKGEVVVRVDPRDYALAVRQSSADIDRARLELELEQSRSKIAEREWKIINENGDAPPEGKALALRKPQLRTAKASLEAAKSSRATARLALSRTTVVAPFNALVQTESVDVGQLVTPQTPLATLVGTDHFWVRVSVPVADLRTIAIPGFNAAEGEGASATIGQDIGGQRVERTGRVVRLLGDLDPVGKMARLLVEIDDPLGLTADDEQGEAATESDVPATDLPMLLGSYVQVEIEGKQLEDVIELPRAALREGDRVFVFVDDKLEVREVSIVRRRKETVLVRSGVNAGDRVITSPIGAPIAGMKLRLSEGGVASAKRGGKKP